MLNYFEAIKKVKTIHPNAHCSRGNGFINAQSYSKYTVYYMDPGFNTAPEGRTRLEAWNNAIKALGLQ